MIDECKSCKITMRLKEGEADRILAGLVAEGHVPASPDEAVRRLEICADCAHLQSGITCRHCGCLVEIRAKLRDKHCPNPVGQLW